MKKITHDQHEVMRPSIALFSLDTVHVAQQRETWSGMLELLPSFENACGKNTGVLLALVQTRVLALSLDLGGSCSNLRAFRP